MKKFFAKKDGDHFVFEGDELNHFNVVRCGLNEEILCLGNDGNDYVCRVDNVSKKLATAKIISSAPNTKNPKLNITVFQGLVKGDKIDLIVQKLTELGVTELYTFESSFTIAKGNNNKIERLIKISEEACKQCGRSFPLKINNTINFKSMLELLNGFDIVLFANEKNTNRNLGVFNGKKNIALVVGSEGGFSDDEINALYNIGAINFGLGARILRAETACIVMSGIIGYLTDV